MAAGSVGFIFKNKTFGGILEEFWEEFLARSDGGTSIEIGGINLNLQRLGVFMKHS